MKYVAEHGSRTTSTFYTVTTMWSALEGSIILWTLILAGYIAAMAIKYRDRVDDPLVGWATLVTFVVAGFFFLLMVGPANPFRTLSGAIPTDGPGPNPLLQNHPLVAVHPPMLYLGFVGFTIPFAFAVASLITGRLGEGWLIDTRRWTLFAWAFLTIGIVLGAWWSYEVLGWGGFWAWDPVENASLLPWLVGTAYLHSVMVQERRGMLRLWNLSLLLATFSLTILGTFLTRSGVLDSVHSFTESGIGPTILGFFGLVVGTTIALIAWRGDRLRSPGAIDSPVSREGAFLVNNLLFAAFAFVVLLGTVFPLIAEAINGQRIAVGEPYFNRMVMPIVVALLFLMAVAPVLPWRKASGELLRHRLQWPAWIAVVTVALCVLFGIRGLNPLLAFGLGAFAAASAGRQLVLATRRQGWRGPTAA
jgi:cytochrome c-type biogenesis protein CcmF